jgi:hypothetical protein
VRRLEDSGILPGDTLKDFLPPRKHPQDAVELLKDTFNSEFVLCVDHAGTTEPLPTSTWQTRTVRPNHPPASATANCLNRDQSTRATRTSRITFLSFHQAGINSQPGFEIHSPVLIVAIARRKPPPISMEITTNPVADRVLGRH